MEKAIVDHCIAFYEELERRAELNDGGVLVFEGNVTKAYRYLGISSTHYSKIKDALIETRSIEILQRGTGAQPSLVVLYGSPDPEILSDSVLTTPRRRATLTGEQGERLEALEKWRESMPLSITQVARILVDYEERIARLEETVSAAISDQSGTERVTVRDENGSSQVEAETEDGNNAK